MHLTESSGSQAASLTSCCTSQNVRDRPECTYGVIVPLHVQFKGQMVLIGVDDMDLFKGIELKLLAVERVLDYHPEWRGRLVLVQVTNAPR